PLPTARAALRAASSFATGLESARRLLCSGANPHFGEAEPFVSRDELVANCGCLVKGPLQPASDPHLPYSRCTQLPGRRVIPVEPFCSTLAHRSGPLRVLRECLLDV